MTAKTLARITGTMLTPGVSRNNRLYTREAIGRMVDRARARVADPDALPIVMRTHHDAGDDSRLIVGRVTDVMQQPDGSATYEAVLYDTTAGRDIGKLIDPKAPALRTTSIHGAWVGPVEHLRQGGNMVESGSDLDVDMVDFTGSPGVTGARIKSVAFESVGRESMAPRADGRVPIAESAEATLTLDEVSADVPDQRNPIFERYSAAQRNAMAAKGQAMPDGSYAIASKSDLRGYLRAVDASTSAAVREHIANRADALGFASMIPGNWGDAPVTEAVDETYVTVCVGDDSGPLVKVSAANIEPGDVKATAKKAAKLAARVLANGPDDDTDADLMVGPGNSDDTSGGASSYDLGDDESHAKENPVAEQTWTITVGETELPEAQVAELVAEATKTPATVAADKATAPAVADQKEVAVGDATKAAETATDPKPLTEADVIRIAAEAAAKAAQNAIKEATDKAAEKAAAKAAKKAAKTTDSGTTAESTPKADGTTLKEGITREQLDEALAAERKTTIAETRDAILKEYGLPSRKGFRHVVENDEKLTADELWDNRKNIFAAAVPSLYAGVELESADAS